MRLMLTVLIGAALLGGGTALGSVSVTIQDAATHGSTVTLQAGQSFTAEVVVQATGEGNGISGIQVDVAAAGGASGGLTMASGGTTAYLGPNWDTAATALEHQTGSIQPGPVGPHGTGWANFPTTVLANGTASTVSNIQINAVTAGTYTVNVAGLAFPDMVTSTNDIAVTPGTALTVTVQASAATVTGRHLFYNLSGFAGSIATNKTAYLGGGVRANFNNVCAHTRGINGIYIDIQNRTQVAPTAADFTFKVGNNNTIGVWPTLAVTPTITVLANTPVAGTDRVKLVFANGSVTDVRWLQVTLKSNANGGTQGLAANDVHYWGGLMGECGLANQATYAIVTSADYQGAYAARTPPNPSPVPITSVYDFDHNKYVLSADYQGSYTNRNHILYWILLP